ncbi:MAG: type II secretion system protein GspL [Roseovarius sp.]
MNAQAGLNSDTPEGAAGGSFPDQFTYLTPGGPAPGPRQIGLVPGAEVPLLEVALPGALRGHAREQVAERQMRDALASGGDLIEVRPFYAPEQQNDWSRVLVADRAHLDNWRAQAGTSCRAVLPDYLALPAGEGLWTLAQPGAVVLARLGPGDGFSASPAVAERLFKEALMAADPSPQAVFAPGAIAPELETLFAAHGVPVVRDETGLKALDLAPPRLLAHGELAFDLRRDPRAARARLRANVLPWRWPLLVGALAAALWAGAQMLAISGVQEQTTQVRAVTLDSVRRDFVPSGPILDVRTQVARALAEARVAASGAGVSVSPLDLLGLSADVMTARNARPDYIDYTPADGLSAVVRVDDFAAADALAAALREAGLKITVVESRVSEADEGVRTELRIAAPEAEQ